MSSITFVHAKKRTRGELRLPQLHFVAVDDWVDKLGNLAFISWLKFYSWADRSDPERQYDNIPNSLNTLVKRLGISKSTFYEKVIRPLWNYGFIDFHQYEKDKTIHVNIIVYEYPQNDPKLATAPIEKIRDYDTEYQSRARKVGKIGGDKKAKNSKRQHEEQEGVVRKSNQGGGSEIEPGVVQKSNQGGTIFGHNNDPNEFNVLEKDNVVKIDQSDNDAIGIASVIQSIIDSDDRLTDRRDNIFAIYRLVKQELQYSDVLFLYTLRKVMAADVKGSFENYFMKALLNNMTTFGDKDAAAQKPSRVQSLPRNVLDQLAIEEVSATIDNPPLTEMNQEDAVRKELRALEMLLQLGDISQEKYERERARLTQKLSK